MKMLGGAYTKATKKKGPKKKKGEEDEGDGNSASKSAKRDLYSDDRDEGDEKKADTMDGWDTEKLNSVVDSKHGKDKNAKTTTMKVRGLPPSCDAWTHARCPAAPLHLQRLGAPLPATGQHAHAGCGDPTSVLPWICFMRACAFSCPQICRHFLKAVEKGQYGWFWECADGAKCKYRHALPPGFVLKKSKEEEDEEEQISLSQLIEEERYGPSSVCLCVYVCLCVCVSVCLCGQNTPGVILFRRTTPAMCAG